MVRNIDLMINILVKGEDALRKLRKETEAMEKSMLREGQIRRTVDASIENTIVRRNLESKTLLTLMNTDRQYINTMVDSEIRAEALNVVSMERIDLLKKERMELVLLEMVKRGEITAEESVMAQKKMRMAIDKEDLRQKQMIRREILATTMSIFGMTMSIWQVTNALSALAGENKELKKDIMSLQAVMMGATGPILFAMGLMQLRVAWTSLSIAIKLGLPTFFALASLYMTLTASSRELRIIFGALTGAMVGLTAVIMMQNFAKAQNIALTWLSIKTKLLEIGLTVIGLPIAMAGIGAALAYYASIPKEGAQTGIGQYRRVEKSGLMMVHKPEIIGNVSPPMEAGRNDRPILVTVNIGDDELMRIWANRAESEEFMGG